MGKKHVKGLVKGLSHSWWWELTHGHIMTVNNSKLFAGIMMIFINVGSKFIPVQFSKSAEEYLRHHVSKPMVVFAMAWLGTRDIYTALLLMVLVVLLSDVLFNEDCAYCIVPPAYRFTRTSDGFSIPSVTEQELIQSIAVLEKAKVAVREYNFQLKAKDKDKAGNKAGNNDVDRTRNKDAADRNKDTTSGSAMSLSFA